MYTTYNVYRVLPVEELDISFDDYTELSNDYFHNFIKCDDRKIGDIEADSELFFIVPFVSKDEICNHKVSILCKGFDGIATDSLMILELKNRFGSGSKALLNVKKRFTVHGMLIKIVLCQEDVDSIFKGYDILKINFQEFNCMCHNSFPPDTFIYELSTRDTVCEYMFTIIQQSFRMCKDDKGLWLPVPLHEQKYPSLLSQYKSTDATGLSGEDRKLIMDKILAGVKPSQAETYICPDICRSLVLDIKIREIRDSDLFFKKFSEQLSQCDLLDYKEVQNNLYD